jgi:hypothetical protein
MSEKLTRNFQTRAAGNLHGPENESMMKQARSGGLAKTGGFAIAVDWPSVEALLEEPNTEGVLRLLEPAITELNRQRVAANGGCHVPTVAEKEQLREQLIVGLIGPRATPPPGLRIVIDIAVRLKNDWGEPKPERSKGFDPAKSAGVDLSKASGEITNMKAQFDRQFQELTAQIVRVLKARTGARQ